MTRPLRVVVVSDRIGDLDSGTAGSALARGFAPHAQVAVVPVAGGGADLARAAGRLTRSVPLLQEDRWVLRADGFVLVGLRQPPAAAWAPSAATADIGEWVAECLAEDHSPKVVLDLTGITAHDGGAGLLAAAGDSLAGRDVVGVVAADELELPATGIGGGLARRAFAGGVDVAELLRADADLAARAEALGEGLATAPGGGAAGCAGLAILAHAGELTSGTQFCHRLSGLDRTLAAADLVVTGCTELSALDRGGPVVSAVAGWAEIAQRPCVLFTPGAGLARRELRTMGIEAAHALDWERPTESALTAAAARIAVGWVSGSRAAHVD